MSVCESDCVCLFSFLFLFLFFENLKIKKIETNLEQKRYSINNQRQMPTLYFYKGTTMPMMKLEEKDAFKLAKEQLALGLRMCNMSLKDQAKDYFKQLDTIESLMYQHCNPTTPKKFKKVCQLLGQSEDAVYILWCLNICCLLILKRMSDDNMNGIMRLE